MLKNAYITSAYSFLKSKILLCGCLIFTILNVYGIEEWPLCPGEISVSPGHKRSWSFTAPDGFKAKPYPHGLGGGLVAYCLKDKLKGTVSTFKKFSPAIDCKGFDQLCYFINNHNGTGELRVKVLVETDKGIKSVTRNVSANYYTSFTDLLVNLDNATKISSIKMECSFVEEGRRSACLKLFRFILRNSSEYQAYVNHYKRLAAVQWEGLLKDESFQPSFKPTLGLMFTEKEVDEFRKEFGSYLRSAAEHIYGKSLVPERFIAPNLRNPREYFLKQGGSHIVPFSVFIAGGNYAYYGMLGKNKKLLRLAARCLLSVCTVEYWGDNAYPQTPYDLVRPAFGDAAYGMAAAKMLDWCGEMLTPQGRLYVLKTLTLKCFATVTYSEWSRPLCFDCNQGPHFLRGKIAALLCAEKSWKRVNAYTDLAKAELDECIGDLFRQDGSYMESSAYLVDALTSMEPYIMFSNARGKKLSDVVPQGLKKSGNFAQLIISTSGNPRRRIISIGQSHTWNNYRLMVLAFLASVAPDSLWGNLFREYDAAAIRKAGKGSLNIWLMCKEAAKSAPGKEKYFVDLKYSGCCSSLRKSNGKKTKIVVIGDAIGMVKKHNDVGSFILEYAGDIYAMDMPFYAGLFDGAEYHNMLVAVDKNNKLTNSMPHTDSTLQFDAEKRNSMRPQAKGDGKTFHAEINPSKSWERRYFKKWIRIIDSPSPDKITITDEYELGSSASGAAFIWMAYLPVKVDGNKITIAGEYGSKCEITVPTDCKIELDKFNPGAAVLKGMALKPDHKCTRIIIRKPGKANEKGKLVVRINLLQK